MRSCLCQETLGNTGEANCKPLAKVTKKIVLVPTYKADGTRNKISKSVLYSQVLLAAAVNNTDPLQRFYPSPLLENVTSERPAPTYETAPSGRKAFIKEGVRSMSMEIWEQGPEYKKQLDKARCNEVSAYIIDLDGSIRGMELATDDGYLYPIKIDNQSWYVSLVMGTDTVTEKLLVTFDWDQTEDDAQLRMIAAGDMTADWLGANGLLDIKSTISAISTTSFTAKLYTVFGSEFSKIPNRGLVAADFALYNVTDSAAVTITTAVESTTVPGTYVFTFSAQTSADVLRLTPTKTGFDYTAVIANTILIP